MEPPVPMNGEVEGSIAPTTKKVPLPADKVIFISTNGEPRWETVALEQIDEDDCDIGEPGVKPYQIAPTDIQRLLGGEASEFIPIGYAYRDKRIKFANGRHWHLYVNADARELNLDVNVFASKHGRGAYPLCGNVVIAMRVKGDRYVGFRECDIVLLPDVLVPKEQR